MPILISLLSFISVLLFCIYLMLVKEEGNGLGSRFKHVKTITRYINNSQSAINKFINEYFISKFELMNCPTEKDFKKGRTFVYLSLAFLAYAIVVREQGLISLVGIMGIIMGIINPYLDVRNREKKFKDKIDEEVTDMLEVFNLYATAGKELEECIVQTSDNIGENLTPYFKRLIASLLTGPKEDAIDILSKELSFNQNMVIFCSALKQAIKGYSDTLTKFISMQSKLQSQLKNEQVDRIIAKMPTKFSMISAILIIAMISFLVAPVLIQVFAGMENFVSF